jgi:hypothetical protein
MPRIPKPWWRKDRLSWFVTINGKRHNLGPNRELAHQEFHRLMTQPKRECVQLQSTLAIMDAYLDWTQRHRAPRTFTWYRTERPSDRKNGRLQHIYCPGHLCLTELDRLVELGHAQA